MLPTNIIELHGVIEFELAMKKMNLDRIRMSPCTLVGVIFLASSLVVVPATME